jgi:hypothetical protein
MSPWYRDGIHSLYEHATASVQINGIFAGSIPIKSAISEGCYLSMALYALNLHPLLSILEEKL